MPTLYRYKLFISHAWNYAEDYKRMVKLLDDAPNFIHSNFSVPEDRAFARMSKSELEEEIRQQIRPVDAVIILGGMYVAYSDWIQFEIDYAKLTNKPVLGVQPWGAERMPQAVTLAANKIVGWNTSTIVAGIREIVL